MGLETGTFINDLTPSWPLASDQKRQGDDHLRLIKSILKTTFPNANKAFYFPTVEQTGTTIALDASDLGNCVELDTSGANVQVNLPSTLTSADRGWWCEVVKTSLDTNAGIVYPAAGTIQTTVGFVATVRVGVVCDAAIFKWTGTRWLCLKPGVHVGETKEWDGAALPPGYLWSDGAAFSAVAFAELAAVMPWLSTRDKRGCVSAGRDTMSGNRGLLDSIGGGSLAVFGGNQSHVITPGQLPASGVTVNITSGSTGLPNVSMNHNHGVPRASLTSIGAAFGGDFQAWGNGITTVSSGDLDLNHFHGGVVATGATVNLGANQVHNNVQPTIIVNKIIRAC